MADDLAEAAAQATRLRELRVANAATWFDDWHSTYYFEVSFEAAPHEVTDELQDALVELTSSACSIAPPERWEEAIGGTMRFDARAGTVEVECHRVTPELTEERFTVDLRDPDAMFSDDEPDVPEPPAEPSEWDAEWHIADRIDNAAELESLGEALASLSDDPEAAEALVSGLKELAAADDDEDDDDDDDIDDALFLEAYHGVIDSVLATLRQAGIARASCAYEATTMGEMFGAIFEELTGSIAADDDRASPEFFASLSTQAKAAVDEVLEDSPWKLTRLEADGKQRRRGGRVGDALSTIATLTLEARVGGWSDLGTDGAAGTLRLDVEGAVVTLDHRRRTWRSLEPERSELAVLEPLP